MSDRITTVRPDTSAASSLLRKYAHFEGEAPPPPPPPATPPATGGNNEGEDDKPIMTSAQLKERLDRDREAQRKKLLAELGIEDPAADAELLKAAKARREADKSEVERAAGEAAKEKTRADKLQVDLDTERQQRVTDQRDGKLKDALTAARIKPERVSAALKLLAVEQDAALTAAIKDGVIDDKAITKVAEDARKAYPEWFGSAGPGSPSNSGGRAVDPGSRDAEARSRRTHGNIIRG